MVKFINLDRQYDNLHPKLLAAYTRVMMSGRYIMGPELDAFEREFAEYCGVAHCVGVANGTDAITLAILANMGIREGFRVAVPSLLLLGLPGLSG